MSCEQASEVKQPAECSLDDPSMFIASQASPVLGRFLFSPPTMWADQLNSPISERCSQPIGVSGPIIQQVLGPLASDLDVDQSLDRIDFGNIGTNCHLGEGQTTTVHEQHDLGSLATFCVSNLETPFFAEANVPSAIACSQCSRFRRSSVVRRRFHASTNFPDSVQSRWRRQQVTGEGNRSGNSFHRAPCLRTQMIPSKQTRESTRGRPPAGEGSGFSNKSLIRFHWASVKNGFGAVLDPVVFGRRRWRQRDRVMSM